ncbi:chemotaxis protein CheW [Marinobacterium weihaiense]|uniref:Chemotaxis protein CheW n=1 Tax=Marinobacterium weihaiense TaxID=2851016 RepID=A0ABS6M9K3_9GAMM|nr:chemotaxis protein CheW [Marinobacterium weihaiense]MBV0932964.1 chemotaxis protein CheW [Marinobacterium weihaiense]
MANTEQVVAEATGSDQYLTFQVLGERYAVNILDIKEIIEVTQMTRVPMALAAVRGVMNLRGNVAPVIDLAQRFHETPTELDRRTVILVVQIEVEGEWQVMGMLAQEVNEIVEIQADQFQPAPEFGAGIRQSFIRHMAQLDGRFIVLLDLARVLSVSELSVHLGDDDRSSERMPAE